MEWEEFGNDEFAFEVKAEASVLNSSNLQGDNSGNMPYNPVENSPMPRDDESLSASTLTSHSTNSRTSDMREYHRQRRLRLKQESESLKAAMSAGLELELTSRTLRAQIEANDQLIASLRRDVAGSDPSETLNDSVPPILPDSWKAPPSQLYIGLRGVYYALLARRPDSEVATMIEHIRRSQTKLQFTRPPNPSYWDQVCMLLNAHVSTESFSTMARSSTVKFEKSVAEAFNKVVELTGPNSSASVQEILDAVEVLRVNYVSNQSDPDLISLLSEEMPIPLAAAAFKRFFE